MALLIPQNRIAVRVYGQGFGDCILIALRKNAASPDVDYIVIDCGIYIGTGSRNARLREVIADVVASTGGKLRALAITHEHFDHVAGWYETAAAWDGITAIQELWLSWTERPGDPFAQAVKDTIHYKFKMAFGLRSAAALNALDAATADIFALNVDYSEATAKALQTAIDFAKSRGATPRYWDPGNVEKWADDLQFVFMGPPRNMGLIYQDQWKAGEPRIALGADGNPLSADAQTDLMRLDNQAIERRLTEMGVDPTEDDELARIRAALGLGTKKGAQTPFDVRFTLKPDDARWKELETQGTKLPKDRYAEDPRRKIDDAGAGDLGRFALQMDNLTNNTSLVFAIRLGDDYYLFVGDAQVGNWYGFFEQPYNLGDRTVSASEILAHTRFYKVGHHGSHNATVFAKGLDLMPNGVVSIVPTEPGRYNGVPDVAPDGVIAKLQAKGPSMRTDLAEARAPFIPGPMSPVTNRPLYVEYNP